MPVLSRNRNVSAYPAAAPKQYLAVPALASPAGRVPRAVLGTLPLALVILTAGVGAAILVMAVDEARIDPYAACPAGSDERRRSGLRLTLSSPTTSSAAKSVGGFHRRRVGRN